MADQSTANSATRMLRPRVWHMLALGPPVGIVSGTLSYWLQYWIDPTIVTRPIGQYGWVVLYNILAWTSWLLFIPLIWRLAATVQISRDRFVRPTLFHLAASLMLAAGVCLVTGYEQYLVMTASGITSAAGRPLAPAFNLKRAFLYTFEWKVLLYWGIVGVHHAFYYAHALGERELSQARLEARLVEARLDALQRQLHPHFVFNTLHAIAGVLHRDPDAAESMLVRLGDLLRAVFRSHAQQEVTLGREIELTQQYLDIQRMRFGAGLRVDVDVPAALRETPVPVLVLQPLVENAIKHGFEGRTDGGTIRISARREGTSLAITVGDTGRGPRGDLTSLRPGVGLSNTRARLEHLYPGRHALTVAAPPAGGFAVTLTVPLAGAPQEEVADILEIPA
jgi:two-component system, LytTR family, sensor kinase